MRGDRGISDYESFSRHVIGTISDFESNLRLQLEWGIGVASNEWRYDLMDVAETARVLHVPVSWVYERTR